MQVATLGTGLASSALPLEPLVLSLVVQNATPELKTIAELLARMGQRRSRSFRWRKKGPPFLRSKSLSSATPANSVWQEGCYEFPWKWAM